MSEYIKNMKWPSSHKPLSLEEMKPSLASLDITDKKQANSLSVAVNNQELVNLKSKLQIRSTDALTIMS